MPLSSNEVVAKLGVTPRQLQWWDEQDFVSVPVVGHTRLYSHSAVLKVAIATQLRDKGVSLQRMRTFNWPSILRAAQSATDDAYLLTDGFHVRIAIGAQQVVECLLAANVPLRMIALAEVTKRITA